MLLGKISQDYFIGVGTISCHDGVCETVKGVTVACFNGISQHLLDREAQTCMVEANEYADAGGRECWMLGLPWPVIGHGIMAGNIAC